MVVASGYLTLYAETKPLQPASAAEVAKFLFKSSPSALRTRGCYKHDVYARCLAVDAKHSSQKYRLSSSKIDFTEGRTGTLAYMLDMYIDLNHQTFDEIIPYPTFAYKKTLQEETWLTPFESMSGRQVTTPLDAMRPVDDSAITEEEIVELTQSAKKVARWLALEFGCKKLKPDIIKRDTVMCSTNLAIMFGCRHQCAAEVFRRNYFAITSGPMGFSPVSPTFATEGNASSSQ